ncbi:MAG: methylglyoxal synthase, partial [Weeksellaceae bacterium]|nr:methylglyoxal synthase [Weeksellaceae bacterium]
MKKVREVPVKKRIALIAHDNKKDELLEWCKAHVSDLQKHKLISTGTTGKMLAKHLKMDVEQVLSGPLGGDQQIGARIADGEIDVVIFFWDPLQAQPHDSDV